MSALFFKRFLQKPFQIASIIPSSKALVERVAAKSISAPRDIAEYGPGEGVHSRELAPGWIAIRSCFSSNWIPLSRAISNGSSPTTRAST
jgi:hypothetical protein